VRLRFELDGRSPSGPSGFAAGGHLPRQAGEETGQLPRQAGEGMGHISRRAGEGRLNKRVTKKTDGRYLIYYERKA
jgi:hypothetical protein